MQGNESPPSRWPLRVAWSASAIAVAVAFANILGWALGSAKLVSYVTASIPMQFNTAVCTLFCGAAVAALLMERHTLAGGLGSIVMAIASLCAVEIFLAPEIGVVRMFFDASSSGLPQTHLAPNSACSLLLAGACTVLLAAGCTRKIFGAIAAVLASGIAAFGAISLSGYAMQLSPAYRWGEKIPMSLPAAVGLVACGVAILSADWHSTPRIGLPSWSPLAMLSALATASVLLFNSLQLDPSLTQSWPPSQKHSLLINTVAILVFGFGTSMAVATAMALAQKNYLRSRQLQAANSALDEEIGQRRAAQDAAEHSNRALRTVSACRQAIAQSESEAELLDRVCEIAVNSGGYRLVWIGFAENDDAKSVRPVAKSGAGAEYLQEGFVTWADEPRGRGPTGISIRTAQPALCRDTLTEESFLPWRERAMQFGFRSTLVVPLLRQGTAFGAISIYAAEAEAFADEDVSLLSQLAGDLVFGIDGLRVRVARRKAEAALHASEERYRCLTVATAQIVWVTDGNGLVRDDMPTWRTFTGMSWAQIQGWGWIDSLHPDDREHTAQVWSDAVASPSQYETEYRIRRADGEYRHMWVRGVPVLETNGDIREWVGTCTDITERKRAEEELSRNAEELKRSNTELQEFAFVASHDLQEPLRKITAFSERLRDRCAGQLDEVSLDFLRRMHSAATRMARLIDSLLEYSRLSTRALPFEDVDLATTFAGVLADVEQRIRESGARVLVRPLPRVMGDPVQLRQLLQNLVANALKFHAPGARPEVAVEACLRDGRWEISVRDNGIGFDPAFAERIFRPFQRLHGRNEYEGSGMGLAICRKIAHRHATDLHVESQPGKGSTFRVSFPQIERKETCPNQYESSSPRMMTTTSC